MARTSRKHLFLTDGTAAVAPIPSKFNVAAYVRLSVEDNNVEDGYSIESQKEMLLHFLEQQEDMTLFSVYCDNGFTGSNFDRDDFNRMMNDIKSGKVNAVVVKDLSRFGRNYIETGNYIEKIFPFMGVRFISLNDNYDSEKDNTADIMLTLRNIVNHVYVTDISRKINAMFATKQKNGDFIGWSAPYGYLKSKESNNKIVVDPETAPTVKQIFEWKVTGIGFMAIARKLNEMGILSPRMRNIANGRYKNPPTNGQYWTDMSVAHIIKNPTYAGHMTQHKYTRSTVNGKQKPLKSDEWVIVRNTHEPIVSDELWETAQAVTRENANNFRVQNRQRRTDKGDNLLKGILICPHCNKPMQQKVDSYGKKCRYYVCNMRRANPNCTTQFIREEILFDVIFAAVKKEITAAADVRILLDKVSKSKSHSDKLANLQQTICEIENRIKRNHSLKISAFSTYGDGLITEQEFKEIKNGYDSEAERLQLEHSAHEKEYACLSSAYSKNNERIATFLKFKTQKSLTREMLSELVEKIIVHGADSIEITWRFDDEYKEICEMAKAGENV